ncbi:MAG: hypothetical protein R3D43_12820 [Tepidamorphaceae bacterium]
MFLAQAMAEALDLVAQALGEFRLPRAEDFRHGRHAPGHFTCWRVSSPSRVSSSCACACSAACWRGILARLRAERATR